MNETTDGVSRPVSDAGAPKKKSKMLLVIVLLVAFALVIALITRFMPGIESGETGGADLAAVVAMVDGVSVTRADLAEKVEQVTVTMAPGTDPTGDAAFELELLNEIINLKLLVKNAEDKGITVSDTDIEKEITALTEMFGGADQFATQLEANGLTFDGLRENMRNELLIRRLVDQETSILDVVVSDEEVKTTYESALAGSSGDQEVPALGDVSEMIRSQLLQQKSAEIVQAYIEELRKSADIEILL